MIVVYTPRNTKNVRKSIVVDGFSKTQAETNFVDKRKEEWNELMKEVTRRDQESYHPL